MEIETSTTETIPEVSSPEKATDESPDKTKEDTEAEKPKAEKRPIEAPKNNGTVTPVKKNVNGIVVQFPELFSMKRDTHFLEKLEGADDIKLQRIAYIECDSEEAATKLQEKLHNSELNSKKVSASRLNLNEKKVLYCNGIKREDTDEILKAAFPEIEKIKRESYNTFILFPSETEARAARTLIQKDGVNGHKIICEFDNSTRDRFAKPEEPAAKKAKVEAAASSEKKEEVKEVKEEEKEIKEEATEEKEEEKPKEEPKED